MDGQKGWTEGLDRRDGQKMWMVKMDGQKGWNGGMDPEEGGTVCTQSKRSLALTQLRCSDVVPAQSPPSLPVCAAEALWSWAE